MPLDHGRRLYQHHRVEDLRPNPVKPNPEKSVGGEEPNPTWALSPQDTHLMSQRDELEFQGGAATKPEAEYGNDGGKNRDHARDGRAVAQKSPAFLGPRSFEQAQVVLHPVLWLDDQCKCPATKPEAEYGNDGGKNRDHARDGRRLRKNLQPFAVLRIFEQAQHEIGGSFA